MMRTLFSLFSNREIAIIIWLLLFLIVLMFTKPFRKFVHDILSILLSKKIIGLIIISIGYFHIPIYLLKWMRFWDMSLFKDTLFWLLLTEIPLLGKAIDSKNNPNLFADVIKNNLKLIAFFEFYIGFWTFKLLTEILLVPISVIIILMNTISTEKHDYLPVKKLTDGMFVIWGLILVINSAYKTICFPEQIFSVDSLKSLLLPLLLLLLNLPFIYSLALYSGYENLFINIKKGAKEKDKIRLQLFLFAGLNLKKLISLRTNLNLTLHRTLNSNDMRKNLLELKSYLSFQIGDNYMKRANYYLTTCVLGILISLIGLILANSEVSISDLISFNFVIIKSRFKEILTYIFSSAFVISIVLLLYAIGLRKKKNEEISQIKKYALFEFVYVLNRQNKLLLFDTPSNDPTVLYTNYLTVADELIEVSTKVLNAYSNLLSQWERDGIDRTKMAAMLLCSSATADGTNIKDYDLLGFCMHYNEKVESNQKRKDYNSYTFSLQRDIEKYTKIITALCDDFKYYY